MAAGPHPARVVLALVEGAAVGVGVAPGAGRALADVAAVLVDTPGSGSAGVTQTLIEVHTLERKGKYYQYYYYYDPTELI